MILERTHVMSVLTVIGYAACIVSFYSPVFGFGLAAAMLFLLIVMKMISTPLKWLQQSMFDLGTLAVLLWYVTICFKNQDYISKDLMPDNWKNYSSYISALLLLHFILITAAPSLLSLTMVFILLFVGMQYALAKFFRVDGFHA